MQDERMKHALVVVALLVSSQVHAQEPGQLEGHNVRISSVTYAGRQAVRIDAHPDAASGASFAVLKGATLHDGTIDVYVAGKPAEGAGAGARGFIGVAFRLQGNRYEHIYLRPTNGRVDDQVRRNHATQYAAHPDYDFARLRKESPEKYESYVDLEPGVWTRMRVEVKGTTARLFVHGASQPCLVVNDLKLGDSTGGVALWVGPGTEGYFANLAITPAPR
jgi:hypothetical protein